MLDQDFFNFLEYEICKSFEYSDNDQIKGFWFDDVLFNQPNNIYDQKFVNANRQIMLKAFIGSDQQTEYELTLKLNNKSLSRFARKLDIKECVPKPNKSNWFAIDAKRNTIEIQLDKRQKASSEQPEQRLAKKRVQCLNELLLTAQRFNA